MIQKPCCMWGCGRPLRHRWRIQGIDWSEPKVIDVCEYHDSMLRGADTVGERLSDARRR